MSLTLGEKLRQAREERGISLSEVAEQTRISPIYLESIDNDDYRNLPGGIFNRGFVKSYAKYVGVNPQEALLDYAALMNEAAGGKEEEEGYKAYRPQVLTDDRSTSSIVPTLILAVVILGLMTGGILFLVNYLQQAPSQSPSNTTVKTNVNSAETNSNTETATPNTPEMATLKVEFKALSAPVSLTATTDGKASNSLVTPGSTSMFEPKESLKLGYSRSLARVVQMTINGKAIALPAVPLNPKRAIIEFEINKENIGQIWASGAISSEVPAANPDAEAIPGRSTPAPKPTGTANTTQTPAAKATNTPKPVPKSTPATKSSPPRPQ